MWFGGEEDPPTSGGSSSDNTTPPVDIMAEEAALALSSDGSIGNIPEHHPPDSMASSMIGSEDTSSEFSDLKMQFEEQENLLGKLKNALKSNEDKLEIKEKEVQV